MKKTIKLIAVVSALFIFASLTGCEVSMNGSDKTDAAQVLTAMDVYQKAIAKEKDTKTGDIDMKMDINMSYQGENNQMSMNMNIKTDQTDAQNIKMAMTGNMTMPTVGDTAINYIYVDNMIFVETAGMKYKSPVDAKTAEEMIGDSNAEDMFGIESFKNIEMTEDGTNKIVDFTCDASQLSGFMKKYINQYSSITNDSQFDDFSGSFVIDKDYNIKSMKMTVGMTNTTEGNAMDLDIKFEINVNSLGEPVAITAPADAASYIDIDPSTLQTTTTA